jgi:CRP-like cAMP-binding protein
MYETLLQLPLFQGLCREDFTHIIGKAKLDFAKYKTEDIIVKRGSECDRLIFVLKGDFYSMTTSNDGMLIVKEQHVAPYVVEPHSLFGMNTRFAASYIALSELQIVSLDKTSLMNELLSYEIFRLNYMNMVCSRAQTMFCRIWQNGIYDNLTDKIIYFILSRTERSQEQKMIKMKMKDMAGYLDKPRLNISKALNRLQEDGLVLLKRKEIIIPDINRLQELYAPTPIQ